MNRTVAYQETSNNYTDTRQQIMGAQISTIKNFGVAPPAGGGDFVGQLGISADASGEAMLYTYGIGGIWKLVGKSGDAGNLPDEVVMEDRENNFTNTNQRIEDCSIMYIDNGTQRPENIAIKGPGHVYVYESNPVQVMVSYDGASWTSIITESAGDVELDKPNNFTDGDQKIQGTNIATLRKGSIPPDPTTIIPLREGELYLQVAEGTADRKARIWVANNAGGWKWEPLTHIYELPNTVAQTSKINDFQATQQTIAGKQIMSFVDGGNQTPEQSHIPADYDGQFYIAVHEFVAGTKEVAIWVAEGNQWIPLKEDLDVRTIVRTNKSNVFTNPNQILGEGGGNSRWLTGARIKFSGASPIADGNWRVQNVGELTVYENNTVIPREMSVWIGISKNPSDVTNAGEWAMVWSSKTGDVTDYALLSKSNDFVPFQYINSGNKRHMINTGHEGGAGSPKSSLVPVAPGDTYTQSYSHPSLGETRNLWIAAIEGDAASWKRVLCAEDHDVVLVNQKNNFESRNQFLGPDSSTKRDRIMGSRYHTASTTGIVGISPTMFGETVMTERVITAQDPVYPDRAGDTLVEIHFATSGDPTARKCWVKIGESWKTDLDLMGDDSNN